MLDPETETRPTEWEYRAEGRAHIVYTYSGHSTTYIDRVLRLRKPTCPPSEMEGVQDTWRTHLLPRLLPPELLVPTEIVMVRSEWVNELFQRTETSRPDFRRAETGPLALKSGDKLNGSIMDEITAHAEGSTTSLSLEIKVN